MDLNPYNSHRFSLNPYKGLPKGFLLYRSCYPIRRDERQDTNVICAPESTGINVRIYKLTEGAYLVNKLSNILDYTDFDEWREISFYEFIREKL